MVGQREVKRVDDHGVGEDGSISIILSGIKVISPRESISRPHVSARGDFPGKIKVLKEKGPANLSSREFVRVLEIGQVLVVSEDRDRVRSSLQVLLPFHKSEDDSKKFAVVDVVVALSQREGFRK